MFMSRTVEDALYVNNTRVMFYFYVFMSQFVHVNIYYLILLLKLNCFQHYHRMDIACGLCPVITIKDIGRGQQQRGQCYGLEKDKSRVTGHSKGQTAICCRKD